MSAPVAIAPAIATAVTADESPVRRRLTRLQRLAVVALAPALLLGVATQASAYTVTSRQNVPVAPTIYTVQGAHQNVGSAVTGPMYKPWVYQSGPVVNRVARGTEYVRVTYNVDRWTGSAWVLAATRSVSVTIGSTVTSAKAPALSVLPSAGAGYYRVRLAMTWTSPIGAVLGSMSVSMNQAGDYVCSTTRSCTVGSGWIYIGS